MVRLAASHTQASCCRLEASIVLQIALEASIVLPEEDYTWPEAEVIESYYYEGGLVFQKGERLRLRSYHPEQDDTWRWVTR